MAHKRSVNLQSKESWPRGPGFDVTPKGFCLPVDAEWNIGMVEGWVCKTECHLFYKRSPSARPNIPSFQFSNTPRHFIMAEPIISDLGQRTSFSNFK